MAHPLDGVRPKHALCASCGYVFGGVAIKGGVIICPECGKATSFDLKDHAGEVERLRARIRMRRTAYLIVFGLFLIVVSVVMGLRN
jgi:hypothetical protein